MVLAIPRTISKSRWLWHIQGQVQGVGFRPFVFRLATHAGITGRVFNDAHGVHLEIQGTSEALASFEAAYTREMPPLAKVESCQRTEMPLISGERGFLIVPTPDSAVPSTLAYPPADAAVTIDTAVCPDCLREMNDPHDRRHRHALINCTNCGPRFSLIRQVPYDRKNTTMAAFPLCPDCRREYENPADRRFHAQPVCCKKCGPKVELMRVVGDGRHTAADGADGVKYRAKHVAGNPFEKAAELLLAGKIVAIKGLGGFHLAVRADLEDAIERLRAFKQRDAKPFALMCRDLPMARQLVQLSTAGETELTSPRAPILLAPRLSTPDPAAPRVTRGVAPGTDLLGILLPYTPVHHLLWQALNDQQGAISPQHPLPPLVLTSGNLSQEPLVIDNADALQRLGPLCDAILWHDRPIERCVDDSVLLDRGPDRLPLPIRRSRGYAPAVWTSNYGHSSGICLGGELKSTIAVVRHGEIILSQHLGDLSDARAYAHFRQAVDDLVRLFHVKVEFIAHDLHPTYMSTHAARELAQQYQARLLPVQHHAAHAYAVMGEHRLDNALALICDGTGYGTDGSIWGGELLEVTGPQWRRLGRLKPMRLPGGDAAAHDPRRSALALLHSAYGEGFSEMPEAAALIPHPGDRRMLARMIAGGFSSPWTSSTGRLFDGIAALLGICFRNDHESQAPMALEAAAWAAPTFTMPEETLFEVRHVLPAASGGGDALWELDLAPFVRWLVGQNRQSAGNTGNQARVFHRVLAEGWISLATAAAGEKRMPLVASGGSFCNRLLELELAKAAAQKPFSTFFHNIYPPTDAGLAFGQAQYSQAQVLTNNP